MSGYRLSSWLPRPAARTAALAAALALVTSPAAAAPTGAVSDDARLGTLASTTSANSRIASVLPARTANRILGSRFTMTVWDTAADQYVFTRRADAVLRGASTTKILTTVAALEALGPSHRMPTTVLSGASSSQVVLRAGGDPLLTSADLRALARDTAAALKSGVPAGASQSATAPVAPSSSPTTASPEPTATASTSAAPSSTGEPATQTPGPSVSAARLALSSTRVTVKVDGTLFPGSGRSRGWSGSFVPWQVRPVSAFARDDNKSRDPAADAGRYFAAALGRYGVRATYGGSGQAPDGAAALARFAGHTIGQAVARALRVSDNDTAEMLFRQVAVGRGRTADWAGAREAERAALADLGVPLSGVEIVDGSGLSLEGRLTAGALSTALLRALSPSHPRLSGLRGWLPVAGRSGTLARSAGRFNTSPAKCAAGMIQAKTGTLADAISLAGYARGADGNTKVFVAVVNGRPTKWSRLTTRRYVDRAVSSLTGCW